MRDLHLDCHPRHPSRFALGDRQPRAKLLILCDTTTSYSDILPYSELNLSNIDLENCKQYLGDETNTTVRCSFIWHIRPSSVRSIEASDLSATLPQLHSRPLLWVRSTALFYCSTVHNLNLSPFLFFARGLDSLVTPNLLLSI